MHRRMLEKANFHLLSGLGERSPELRREEREGKSGHIAAALSALQSGACGRPVTLETGSFLAWRRHLWLRSANEGLRRGGGGAGAQLGQVMEAPAAGVLLLLCLGAWAPALSAASSEAPPLVNEDVKRTVDLSSHLAKVTAEVVLAHPGGGSAPRAFFLLALEPELESRLAHLGVQVSASPAPLGLWGPGARAAGCGRREVGARGGGEPGSAGSRRPQLVRGPRPPGTRQHQVPGAGRRPRGSSRSPRRPSLGSGCPTGRSGDLPPAIASSPCSGGRQTS
jgi:hypothetical protein